MSNKINKQFIVMAIVVCFACKDIEAANILAIVPTFSPSHLIIEMATVRAMTERNHNVTVISVLPLKAEWLTPNMNHIQLDKGHVDMQEAVKNINMNGLAKYINTIKLMREMTSSIAEIMNDQKLQELLKNPGNKFDLMMFGYVFGDYIFGIAEHFDCPVAVVWPNIPMPAIMGIIGNPLELSYTTLTLMNYISDTITFWFRLKNMFSVAIERLMMEFPQADLMKDVYRKHFPSDKYVSYEQAKQRVSLVLFSHHFSEKPVRPLVPGLVEIGGIHLNEQPKPLPKDIEEFVSSAKHGVIYFSMGTNVKFDHLQDGAWQKIYNVLSKLPQKVLWKWEADEAKELGNSTNILFRKWLPQGDILGHANIKLFFGHGGKGGITEAKFYGVPMVGLPIFGDQPMNMEEVVTKGYGVSLNHDETLTEEMISTAVMEVLNNRSYADNVKRFSTLYRDRPLSPKDNAVYWLEYVIRHKGAAHMQSPLKSMSFIESSNLDVFAFIGIVLYIAYKLIKFTSKLVLKLVCRKVKKSKKE